MKGRKEERSITELAGSWNMSESEARQIAKALREGWSRWKARRSAYTTVLIDNLRGRKESIEFFREFEANGTNLERSAL